MKIIEPPATGGPAQQVFELQRVDYGAAEASGRVSGVQAGFPLWQVVWTLGKLGPQRSDAWRAFFASVRGATRRFLARDRARLYPFAYPGGFAGMTRAGGGSFDGSCTSWSETLTADGDSQVALHGLPAGFTLSIGDYVGFRWTATESEVAGLTWHAPVRTVAAATADGSGVVTVMCEPPLPLAVPGTAVAYLNEPAAVMALVSDQSNLGPIDRSGGISSGTIAAIQDIRS